VQRPALKRHLEPDDTTPESASALPDPDATVEARDEDMEILMDLDPSPKPPPLPPTARGSRSSTPLLGEPVDVGGAHAGAHDVLEVPQDVADDPACSIHDLDLGRRFEHHLTHARSPIVGAHTPLPGPQGPQKTGL